MTDELLNISYIEQAIDQVLVKLNISGEFLTQSEKLEKIKSKNRDVFDHLMRLIDRGIDDPNFDGNRKKLVKSLG